MACGRGAAYGPRRQLHSPHKQRRIWLGAVCEVLDAADDVEALRIAVGSHGRKPGAAAGAGSGPEPSPECWIDEAGFGKRHLTVLMWASKRGRVRCVAALIDEFGAGVNVQAPRSLLTALLSAAYEGHGEVVQALLVSIRTRTLACEWGRVHASVFFQCISGQGRRPAHDQQARRGRCKSRQIIE